MYTMKHEVMLSDTDVTGQVYYARPLEWLEWCRVKWFTEQFGNFMAHVEKTGITFFPSKVQADYKKPMFFGDKLTIEMTAQDVKGVSFVLAYRIRREDEVVFEGQVTMVCFDQNRKRLGKITDDFKSAIADIAGVSA